MELWKPSRKEKLKQSVSNIGRNLGNVARKKFNEYEEEEAFKAKIRKQERRRQIAREIKAEYRGGSGGPSIASPFPAGAFSDPRATPKKPKPIKKKRKKGGGRTITIRM